MEQKQTLKKRLENFFYYYKWHTIIAVVAVILLFTTLSQIRNRIEYDTTITFLGSFSQEEATIKEFQNRMEQVAEDANSDGEVHVLPYFLLISGDVMSAQLDTASMARLQGMVMTRETSVMILGEGAMTALAEGEALEDLTPFYEEYGLEPEETNYGIPISENNSLLSGFLAGNHQYFLCRLAKYDDMTPEQIADYHNAEQIIRTLIEAQID